MARTKSYNRHRSAPVVLAALATAATLSLSSCAAASPEPGVTELTMWLFDAPNLEVWEQMADAYEAENPDVSISFVSHPDSDYVRLLSTAWSSNSGGPDVAVIKAYGIFQSFIDAGNLQALDPADYPELEMFDDQMVQAVSSREDGTNYGIPFGLVTGEVYYNQAIFDELGLSEPSTWTEFISVMDTISKSGVTPLVWPSGEAVHGTHGVDILTSARRGGTAFQEDFISGAKDLTDPDFVAGLELIHEVQPYLVDSAAAVTREEALALFASERAAMYLIGPWQIGAIRDANPELEFSTFDVPVDSDWPSSEPVKPGLSDGGVAISAKTPHPEESADLLRWLSTHEAQQLHADISGKMPARNDVVVTDPVVAKIVDDYRAHATGQFFTKYLRYGVPSGTDLMGEGLQKLLLGESAESVAQEIQDGISEWFVPIAGS